MNRATLMKSVSTSAQSSWSQLVRRARNLWFVHNDGSKCCRSLDPPCSRFLVTDCTVQMSFLSVLTLRVQRNTVCDAVWFEHHGTRL